MPLQLTTPIDTGDIDNGKTYTQVKITSYRVDILAHALYLYYEFGNTTDGEWEKGMALSTKEVVIRDQEFLALVATPVVVGGTIYSTVSEALYDYLIDNGIVVGEEV